MIFEKTANLKGKSKIDYFSLVIFQYFRRKTSSYRLQQTLLVFPATIQSFIVHLASICHAPLHIVAYFTDLVFSCQNVVCLELKMKIEPFLQFQERLHSLVFSFVLQQILDNLSFPLHPRLLPLILKLYFCLGFTCLHQKKNHYSQFFHMVYSQRG